MYKKGRLAPFCFGSGSAATAATDEQQCDNQDPDHVVIVEKVAQTVIHEISPSFVSLEEVPCGLPQ